MRQGKFIAVARFLGACFSGALTIRPLQVRNALPRRANDGADFALYGPLMPLISLPIVIGFRIINYYIFYRNASQGMVK